MARYLFFFIGAVIFILSDVLYLSVSTLSSVADQLPPNSLPFPSQKKFFALFSPFLLLFFDTLGIISHRDLFVSHVEFENDRATW